MTKMIRAGYEAADVNMWQALCQQAKCEIGNSHEYLFLLLDMANHNKCNVLDVVKTGRVSSGQKNINQLFIDSVVNLVASTDDDEVAAGHSSTKVLDLTCEEELSESNSYEEEYNDNPNSNEAYEIDGFVVEDDDIEEEETKPLTKKRLIKREE